MQDHLRATSSGSWARWNATGSPYTVGVENELMLLESGDLSLAERSDAVIRELSPELTAHTSQETHAGVLELATGVHRDVSGAVSELWRLRRQLAFELRAGGLACASAGMHPVRSAQAPKISGSARYRFIADTMRCLALQEPTMALHVHVAVLDPDDATRVLRRMRESLPLLVALSANSPFAQGRDTGFASARTVTADRFPRTGPPRAFTGYEEYVAAIDGLIASGVVPDPSFLWWDVRLRPSLGTVEVRAMDAPSRMADLAPLVALVQALARLELEGGLDLPASGPELLAENRFLAARDGLASHLVDPATGRLTPARVMLTRLVERCEPHAAALGSEAELQWADRLVETNGAIWQRSWAYGRGDLPSMLRRLAEQFTTPPLAAGKAPAVTQSG